ncbi:ankyrin repeat-containing domain protein [Ustulina deusta]|nr:ankyrin repeat-containing domain protein [Ustulina deusta]
MVFKTVKNKFLRRGRKDSQKQKLKPEAQTSTVEEASSDAPVNLDGSSTLTPPPVDTPPAQSSPPGGSSSKSSPTLTDGDTPIQDLWNLAYTNLRIEDEELIAKYEAQLSGNLSAGLVLTLGSKFCVKDHMHAILQRKMDEVNRDAWKLKFGSSDVQVREVVQPVLGVVNRANNFITAAVSANPHASLAWVGVSVLLPLFLNPSEQAASLAKGLDHISSLITQSWMWEDLYVRRYESESSDHKSSMLSHAAYKNTLEKLYRHILKFQATSYCYYTRKTASRLGLDILKWNEWDNMLNEIRDKELGFSAIRGIWRDMKYDEECSAAATRHQEAIGHWQAIGASVLGLQDAVLEAQEEKNQGEFLDWLCKVDPSEMYNSARDKHESGTCDWLVKDREEFKTWERSPSSLLWLHGKPGCGKSILSSSVVKRLQERYTSDPGSAFAYFFFSFSDQEKQKVDTMLSSLIKQLYVSRPETPQLIKDLRVYKKKGERPDTKTLEDALMATTGGFSSVSLVLDALDECPTVDGERSKLLGTLRRIIAKMPDNLHIFLTSRAEPDIGAEINAILSRSSPFRVAIDLTADQWGVNRDIGLYIDSRLASADYSSWPNGVKAKAKDLLIKRADGMFQYIVYQFEALKNLVSAADVDKALEQLPLGLNATYDRVLQNIDSMFQARVVSMLKWLVASVRPLLLEELAEASILRPELPIPFDESQRPFQPKECLRYISSLTVLFTMGARDWVEEGTYVRLAHFSVKEHLTSNRIADSRVSGFLFTELDAHLHIAHTSLAYHLYCSTMSKEDVSDLDLEGYSAGNWAEHLEMVPREKWQNSHVCLAARALALGSKSLRRTITRKESRLAYPDVVETSTIRRRPRPNHYMLQRPQCYTARLGYLKLTKMLLPGGPWANMYLGQRGLDAALQEAACEGRIEIVQLLLDKGARANAESDRLGGALQAAAFDGHAEIADLLLDNGADVNAQHGKFGSALQIAVSNDDLHFVQVLVNRGADVNLAPATGYPVTALAILPSTFGGMRSLAMLQYLLDGGANTNRQGSTGKTLLQVAAENIQHAEEHLRLLLERGADVNGQGGEHGNALQAICTVSRVMKDAEIRGKVELLLERGANINAEGGKYGNALQAACYHHDRDDGLAGSVVELLLDRGANINAQGGQWRTALQAACTRPGQFELVKFLLEKGADVKIQGGEHGNALQAACTWESPPIFRRWGNRKAIYESRGVAQVLLDKGADVNATGGKFGSALQAVAARSKGRHDVHDVELLKLLLSKGAEVNKQGGRYSTALQAACAKGNIDAVRMLLDHGAEVNAQGGKYGTALQAACQKSRSDRHCLTRVDIARLLIERGANIHMQGGVFGSAWHAAASIRPGRFEPYYDITPLLQLLLDHGADIDGKEGQQHTTALQAILEVDDRRLDREWLFDDERNLIGQVRFLLDRGADVNIQAGMHGFPLQSACANKSSENGAIYLLQNCPGLEINAVGGIFGSALQAAAHTGQTDSVKLLLEKGADPNARGGKYRGALNAAVLQGFWHIVEILLHHGAKSDREQLLKPDEEWLARIQEEGVEEADGWKGNGEEAVERYWIFWEKQPASEGGI